MIDDTLAKLEDRIHAVESRGDGSRKELLALVAELRAELGAISETHADDAAALAHHVREAGSGGRVEDSIRSFESTHPKIVGLVRSLMNTLADAGI